VCQRKRVTLTRDQAEILFSSQQGTSTFNELCDFLCSGPSIALELSRVDAVAEFQNLMGPSDSREAKRFAKKSIRGRFGTDYMRNAIHGSDNSDNVLMEVRTIFGEVCEKDSPPAAYLNSTVLPVINEALTELCKVSRCVIISMH
jgi:nucleoside-diphosphate kinase